uniref:YqaJ viral recombinase domain-containing protein n=1 Tax=viral metagenome TaxID=1070528 RepID=A0A6C0AZN0_9ZZZZ
MLLEELENLENIIDDIFPEEEASILTEEEEIDIVNTCIQLMSDYIDEHPSAISEPDFHESIIENSKELMFMHFDNFFNTNSEIEEEVDELIDIAAELFYIHIIPKRSFLGTFERKYSHQERERIQNRLIELADVPQATQRTKEWYETRHKLITASNAYKVFENDSARNQLIYEKCQPLQIEEASGKYEQVNTTTPMHWGQKYEPVSIMYYESTFSTKVAEYGCIQHGKYPFLGASPDGIVSDPLLPRFGRMLEIKNIVNRDIDGIPKKEYWIQMQLQMETCDLNDCDFLETRFLEYTGHTDFSQDGEFLLSKTNELKGIIMYFSSPEGKPVYIYKPLHMTEDYYDSVWEPQQRSEQINKGNSWIKNIYWRLNEVSCVLVVRNRKWFQDNVPILSETWDIILKERASGCEHRAPNKRSKKSAIVEETQCLLKLDKTSGKVTLGSSKNSKIVTMQPIIESFIRIRTESIDETKKKNLDNV